MAGKFDRVFVFPNGKTRHTVRGHLTEYVAARRGRVTFVEAFCGRKAIIKASRGGVQVKVESIGAGKRPRLPLCEGCIAAVAAFEARGG